MFSFFSSRFCPSSGGMQAEVADSIIANGSRSNASGFVRGLDFLEKVILLTFYGTFLLPILEAICLRGDWGAFFLGLSETLVIGFVLVRKPAQHLSQRPLDWLLAFGATLAPTLVRPAPGAEGALASAAVWLMLSGLCFQIVSKLMLGRRFGIVAANRGICASGPYRLVRHPIYMGYLLTHIGFLCIAPTSWNFMMYALTYSLMLPRIFAEERLLRRDPQYAAYCEQVRSRLIPGVL